MVPHSRRRHIRQSANILHDCCVHWHREWGTMAAAVGHLGHDVSTKVVGLLWVVSYVGICRYSVPGNWQCPPDKVTMSTPAGIGAVGLAASMLNRLLCCIVREGTLWGNDAWRRWRWNRRKRSRRWRFLQQASSYLDRSWRLPSSYGHHGAPLLAFKHKTISKHTMEQIYIVKN